MLRLAINSLARRTFKRNTMSKYILSEKTPKVVQELR